MRNRGCLAQSLIICLITSLPVNAQSLAHKYYKLAGVGSMMALVECLEGLGYSDATMGPLVRPEMEDAGITFQNIYDYAGSRGAQSMLAIARRRGLWEPSHDRKKCIANQSIMKDSILEWVEQSRLR